MYTGLMENITALIARYVALAPIIRCWADDERVYFRHVAGFSGYITPAELAERVRRLEEGRL